MFERYIGTETGSLGAAHATTIRASTLLVRSLVLLVILPAQLGLNSPWQPVVSMGLVAYVVLAISVLLVVSVQLRVKVPASVGWLGVGLLAAAAISLGTTGSPTALLVYGSLIALFAATAFLARRCRDLDRLIVGIVLGASLTGLFLAFMGLAVEPLSLRRYQGLFNNPNSMGWFTAGLLHLTLGTFYTYWDDLRRIARWVLLLTMTVSLVLLFASNSRTALGSVLAVVFVLITLRATQAVNLRRMTVNARKGRFVFVAISGLLLVATAAFALGLLDEVVHKFTETAARGALMQGRIGAWMASIEHWNWFGYGPDYAPAIGREGMVIGHSTFISHLSRYGLLATVLFLVLLMYMVIWAWRRTQRYEARGATVLLATVVGFMTNASLETGTSTPGLLVSVVMFAIMLQRETTATPGRKSRRSAGIT